MPLMLSVDLTKRGEDI